MGEGTDSSRQRHSRGVPALNKEQTTFLLVSWISSPRFGGIIKWGRGVDTGLSAFIVSIKYFKITNQTSQQNQSPAFTLVAH